MIDGDIIRERIIEQNASVENWADVQGSRRADLRLGAGRHHRPLRVNLWGPGRIERKQTSAARHQRPVWYPQAELTAPFHAPWFTAVLVALTLLALTPFFQWLKGYSHQTFTLLMASSFALVCYKSDNAPGSRVSALTLHLRAVNIAGRAYIVFFILACCLLNEYWPVPVIVAFMGVIILVLRGRFDEARLHEFPRDLNVLS